MLMNNLKEKGRFTGPFTPSNSQLQGWRAGREHKNFRRIEERELLAFIDGLIEWRDNQ